MLCIAGRLLLWALLKFTLAQRPLCSEPGTRSVVADGSTRSAPASALGVVQRAVKPLNLLINTYPSPLR